MSLGKKLDGIALQLEGAKHWAGDERFRLDPAAFAAEALGMNLDSWQREVVAGDSRRDILNCSRQAGKSSTAAVLALHEAIYKPGSVTVLISPSQRQSSELFKKVVELRGRLSTALPLTEDNKLSMTVAGGGRVLSLPGSEATIRGISAVTLLIEDEAARVPDELYSAIRPMLATTNGRLVLMSTPFGKRGHFWKVWDEAPGWRKVRITAEECPRITPEFLAEEQASHNESWFLQEYFCQFVDAERAVFGYDSVMAALDNTLEPLGFLA